MRAGVRGLGEGAGDEEDERRERGENVVLLPGGEGEEGEGDGGPEEKEEAGALVGREGVGAEAGAESSGAERKGFSEGGGKEGGPGQEPDEEEAEKEPERDGVVVAGDTEVEVAEELLIDEVEPGPAVDVALGGERDGEVAVGEGEATGMPLGGVGEGGEDVPGSGDQQEDGGAGERVKLTEAAERASPVVGGEEGCQDDGDGKDDADQALGKDVEGAGEGEGPAEKAGGLGLLLGAPEGEQGKGEPAADEDVRDIDAGKDEEAEARKGDEAGVEAGATRVEGCAGEVFEQEREQEDGQGEGETGSGGRDAEELEAGGHGPVKERGFLEIADAVGIEGDEVVAEEHLAGDFGVNGVSVVEQGRGEEGEGGVEEQPQGDEKRTIAAEGHLIKTKCKWI